MQVLIVEDETKMAKLLERGLKMEGHSVVLTHTGGEGLETAQTYKFDAIVLDIMLPEIDGFEVARRLRQNKNRTPILMLTARDALPDKVKGLDLGADDYLTKPFSFIEFLARLRAVSRRGPIPQSTTLQVADLVLNPASHEVFRGNQQIVLTRTEFSLLELLMRNAGRVLTRDSIIEALWNSEESVEDNTLNVFISLLRKKIDGRQKVKLIQTVHGDGYRIHGGKEL